MTRTVTDTRRGPKLHPGLHGLELRDWLLVDEHTFAEQLGEKESALAHRRDEVLQASGHFGAQEEVRQMVIEHLLARYPEHYTREEESIGVAVGGYERSVDVPAAQPAGAPPLEAAAGAPPLEAAFRLVQEDLVLMQRASSEEAGGEEADPEYRIAAAAVAFSFGNLEERVGSRHSMAELHAKVGNYDRDLHKPVARAMHALKPGSPMWRTNWTFSFSGSMTRPKQQVLNLERLGPSDADALVARIDASGVAEVLFVKTEYQTLRRLPQHTDFVLFTVRTLLTPMSALEGLPAAAALLAENVRGAAELDFRFYKGLGDRRIVERVVEYLDRCARV